mgnify:CR=1 FL=1
MTVPVLQVKNLYKLFIPLEHSQNEKKAMAMLCLLYTSDAADE